MLCSLIPSFTPRMNVQIHLGIRSVLYNKQPLCTTNTAGPGAVDFGVTNPLHTALLLALPIISGCVLCLSVKFLQNQINNFLDTLIP